MSIGKNIKRYRKMKGLTQVDLALRANVSRSYLGDIEGDRYNPSIGTLRALAEALEVNIESLISATGYAPEDFKNSVTKKPVIKQVAQVASGFIDTEMRELLLAYCRAPDSVKKAMWAAASGYDSKSLQHLYEKAIEHKENERRAGTISTIDYAKWVACAKLRYDRVLSAKTPADDFKDWINEQTEVTDGRC